MGLMNQMLCQSCTHTAGGAKLIIGGSPKDVMEMMNCSKFGGNPFSGFWDSSLFPKKVEPQTGNATHKG